MIKRFFVLPTAYSSTKEQNGNTRDENGHLLLRKQTQNFPGGFQPQRLSVIHSETKTIKECLSIYPKKSHAVEMSPFVMSLFQRMRYQKKKDKPELLENG